MAIEDRGSAATSSSIDENRLALLAMALTPNLGPKRIADAVLQLACPAQLFALTLTELEGLRFPADAARFIFDGKARRAAEEEAQQLTAKGATLITLASPEYPERLKEIYDPPPVLWVRGDVGLLLRPSIAIVGTRHPSPYGMQVAEMLARDLSARCLVIVSGMARGIDTCAHKGALSARSPNIAVWGTGIDVVYPKENRKLAEEILAAGGTIVSEVPMGTFPAPQNFPRRNRIISGLSVGVLVVEASENSGTRVTARCAAEQDRDLYAVPGNVTAKNSWTPNTLIKQGAKLVASWEDHPAQPYPYAVLVAAYTIGAELEGGIRRFMVFGFMVGDLVAEFLHGAQDHADDFFVTFLTTITAMLVGALMRTQRAYARVMEERAAELEREHAAAVERAAAAERARIARDMHDVVGHAVALMVVQAEAGPLFLRKDPDKAEAAFDAISAAGRDAMSQLRRLLGVLKHDGADGPGGTATRAPAPTLAMVDDLVAQVRAGGLTVALTSTGTPVPLAADAETAAYRVVQEALTNTMKHAGAARSEVRMEWSEGGLSLTVADDGRGAGRDSGPAGRAASAGGGGGHGLVGLTERLAAVGGTLETPRRDGGGFVLVASIPAARNETVKAG